MREFKPFDVVVVPFPYSDRLAEKRRPAVVVSDPLPSGHVRLVMITSSTHDPWPHDVPIQDPQRAGLPPPSIIRSAKVATAESARVLLAIGQLDHSTAVQLRQALIDGIPEASAVQP